MVMCFLTAYRAALDIACMSGLSQETESLILPSRKDYVRTLPDEVTDENNSQLFKWLQQTMVLALPDNGILVLYCYQWRCKF